MRGSRVGPPFFCAFPYLTVQYDGLERALERIAAADRRTIVFV